MSENKVHQKQFITMFPLEIVKFAICQCSDRTLSTR